MSDNPRPTSRLRYLQFSCKTLLVLMLAAGVVFAWWSERQRLDERLRRSEDMLTVLQAALGDEGGWEEEVDFVGTMPYPYPAQNNEDHSRYALYCVFDQNQEWLSQNFRHNHVRQNEEPWREFLDSHRPWANQFVTRNDTATETDGQEGLDGNLEMPPFAADRLMPVVAKLLRADSIETRRKLLFHLGACGPHVRDVLPQVVELLDDSDAEIRQIAFANLMMRRTWPNARDHLPRMKELLQDEHAREPYLIVKAIREIDPKYDIVEELTTLLGHDDPQTREIAMIGLMAWGPSEKTRSALPELGALLQDQEVAMRRLATKAIGLLAPREEAMTILLAALKDEPDAYVRKCMARVVLRLKADLKMAPEPEPKPPPPISLNQPRGSETRVYR